MSRKGAPQANILSGIDDTSSLGDLPIKRRIVERGLSSVRTKRRCNDKSSALDRLEIRLITRVYPVVVESMESKSLPTLGQSIDSVKLE